jgi:hypothetical protein
MRRFVLLVVATVLTASGLHGQEGSSPQPGAQQQPSPAQPQQLMVAPNAVKTQAEPPSDRRSAAAVAGKPANICQELVAFIEQKQAPGSPPAGQAAPAAAPAVQARQNPAQAAPGQAPAVDTPQHASGQIAPIPQNGGGGKSPALTLEQARGYAQANDLRACQEAVRQMRRAGVALPDGLIALAALRPDLLEAGNR